MHICTTTAPLTKIVTCYEIPLNEGVFERIGCFQIFNFVKRKLFIIDEPPSNLLQSTRDLCGEKLSLMARQ